MASLALRSARLSLARNATPAAQLLGALSRPATVGISRQLTTTSRTRAQFEVIKDDSTLLAQQRLRRPVSPHLTIYRWQITWIPSTLMRISGVAMGGVMYLYGLAYLAAPTIGLDLSTASLAAGFAAWPLVAQIAVKTIAAWPLSFHFFNSLRFLSWDTATGVNNKSVAATGWALVAVSTLTTLGLALFL